MAYETPKIKMVKDNILQIHHPSELEVETQLTASIAATGTSLTVRNNGGFANGDLLLYEGYGNENAEIKKVNAVVTAGTSLTSTAVTFAHAIDCQLSRILWDQVEISGASSATGSKTVIATANIDPSGVYTEYVVTGTTYAYYFVRYYNSVTAVYSSYSDAIAYTDFVPGTVGFVRRAAFDNVDQPFEGKFTADWVYDQIYQCELDILKAKDKWSSLVKLDHDLGDISTGMARIALPSDIEDGRTNKAILGLRIAGRDNMTFVDFADWQRIMFDVQHTTMASTASVGATTLVLSDSRDFKDSGTVSIAGTDYTYTTNTRATNTLGGLTALTAEIASGLDVFQGMTLGEPRRYTVNDGYAYFDTAPSSDWSGRNIWMDYFRTAQRHVSDGDSLLMNDPGAYISWLEAAIKKKKGSGELSVNDNSIQDYQRRKALLAAKDKNPYGVRVIPDVPRVHHRRPFGWWRG